MRTGHLVILVAAMSASAAVYAGGRTPPGRADAPTSLPSSPAPKTPRQDTRSPQALVTGRSIYTPPSDPFGTDQQCPAPKRLNWRELKINAEATALHLGLKTYPETLKLKDHEVVLTFDDGPSPTTTPSILAALRSECVRANFFVIGRHADATPDLVRQEVIEGHIVGHHSYSHPSLTLRGFDEASAERDIDDGIGAVERAAYGAEARPPASPHVPFFRFPGFADSPALLGFLDKRHIAVFSTDIWAADWLNMTPDYERKHVIDQLENEPHHSGIVLFHDTRPSTAAMLPAFLRELKAKGYHVVQLVPAGAGPAPLLSLAPDGWTSRTEEIIAHVWPKIDPGKVHSLPLGSAGGDLPLTSASDVGRAPH